MKTKVLYTICFILILWMANGNIAISQNSTTFVTGDEYWDSHFGIPGMNGEVDCFLKHDGVLYAGGEFTMAGGNSINRIAKWDGTSWSNLGFGFDENIVFTIEFFNNELYTGGIFYHSNNQKMWHFAKWNGTEWVQPGSDIDFQVNCLVSSGDLLYLGGSMISTAGIELNGIAAWDGSGFHSLAGGFWKQYESENPSVNDIKFMDGDLYAGGYFDKAGGVDALNVARWDGMSWYPLGDGIQGEDAIVNSLAVMDGDLFVAGGFSQAGGVTVSNIAKWDGTQWSPLGSGINGPVFVLTVMGDKLYAGGSFSSAGGVDAHNIAMWDGNQWSALGSGTDNWVKALFADDGILYVGGRFITAGNKSSYHIALWNPALSVEYHDINSNVLLNICPNPASVSTEINYKVNKAGHVRLIIYDLNGRELTTLFDGMQHAGNRHLTFETTELQPGLYFVRLTVDDKSVTKKLIVK